MDPVLVLGEQRLQVEPGGETRVAATVRNVGDLVEQYRLEVLGDAARWSQVVPRQVSVLPGAAEEKTVEIVFRPPPPPATVAGEVPFGLRCVSLERQDRCAVVEGDLAVGAVLGLQAHLDPVAPSGAWTGRYRVVLANTGSVPVQLELAAADSRRMLRFALGPRELTVEPGQSVSAYLAVRPRKPKLRGKPVTHAFTVTYQTVGSDRGVDLPGAYEQRPVLSKVLIAAGLLLVAAAAVAAALLLRHGGKDDGPKAIAGPPPPVALTAADRLTDTSVQLVWQKSPYATGYVVQEMLANGSVAASKQVTDRDQAALAWSQLRPGRHCFRVLAVGLAGRSAPSDALCAVLAKPAPSPAPGASAPPTPTSAPGGAVPGGAGPNPPPQAQPTNPPADGGAEPVQGAYVIYGKPTAIDDKAAQGKAEELVSRLQAAGVAARLVDSRDSKRVADGIAGLWVVLRDGFPDFAAALAECDAHRTLAGGCYAFPP